MHNIRVTIEFGFEMAHALWNYDGACKNIHGHSYKLFVTVIGRPSDREGHPKFGMVIDFKDLKDIVKNSVIKQLDHALVVYRKAEGESLSAVKKMYDKVMVLDF
ncbi:MAG TPA: 6-carboxytetrahydropterin synthase, partial [Bacteroidaceae bacterium]|nr:6-carboxytetrahydropterin synthase [Bacteroidaceae bacterium]